MNPHQHLSINPNSLKSRFTKGFLRSLIKINKRVPTSSCSCPREIFQRCRRVKTAADKSLACAVGSRRAWSRAMLFKIRNQARRRRICHLSVRRIIKNRSSKRSFSLEDKKNKNKIRSDEEGGVDQASKLRKLVPGGEGMDMCSLLDEAAHYVKCLKTQVQVMRCIADHFTST